jgi:hypothetical protein
MITRMVWRLRKSDGLAQLATRSVPAKAGTYVRGILADPFRVKPEPTRAAFSPLRSA